MSVTGDRPDDDLDLTAAAWVVRLSSETVEEADWLAFVAWLDGAPADDPDLRRRAFDRCQSVWLDADRLAVAPTPTPAQAQALAPAARRTRGRARPGRTFHAKETFAAAAAAAVAVVALGVVWTLKTAPPASRTGTVASVYATAPGERRAVRLADGTRVALDGATRLVVERMDAHGRELRLAEGEADFDVVHDPARPFRLDLGSSRVRVLGTAFDVVRSEGRTAVSVERGLVSFDTARGDVRLPAGRAASLTPTALKVSQVAPTDAAAWRDGRRLYWDQPLTDVISDLNRSYPHPLRLGDAAARRMRFTGVLVLGTPTETVRRLTALLPLRAQASPDGTVVLSSRGPLD